MVANRYSMLYDTNVGFTHVRIRTCIIIIKEIYINAVRTF